MNSSTTTESTNKSSIVVGSLPIPESVVRCIFSFFPTPLLHRELAFVSKNWHAVITSEDIWSMILNRDFPVASSLLDSSTLKSARDKYISLCHSSYRWCRVTVDPIAIQEQRMSLFDRQFKGIMVGDSKVGKTSLLLRLAELDVTPDNIKKIPKTEMAFHTAEVYNSVTAEIVRLQLFDTNSPEASKYYSRVEAYTAAVHGIIAVYDTTRSSTLESIFNKWIPLARKVCRGSGAIVVVGAKADDVDHRDVNIEEVTKRCQEYNVTAHFTVGDDDQVEQQVLRVLSHFSNQVQREIVERKQEHSAATSWTASSSATKGSTPIQPATTPKTINKSVSSKEKHLPISEGDWSTRATSKRRRIAYGETIGALSITGILHGGLDVSGLPANEDTQTVALNEIKRPDSVTLAHRQIRSTPLHSMETTEDAMNPEEEASAYDDLDEMGDDMGMVLGGGGGTRVGGDDDSDDEGGMGMGMGGLGGGGLGKPSANSDSDTDPSEEGEHIANKGGLVGAGNLGRPEDNNETQDSKMGEDDPISDPELESKETSSLELSSDEDNDNPIQNREASTSNSHRLVSPSEVSSSHGGSSRLEELAGVKTLPPEDDPYNTNNTFVSVTSPQPNNNHGSSVILPSSPKRSSQTHSKPRADDTQSPTKSRSFFSRKPSIRTMINKKRAGDESTLDSDSNEPSPKSSKDKDCIIS